MYRRCGCIDPDTGKAWGDRCPKLKSGGPHGSWYLRLELAAGLDGHRRRVRRGGFPTKTAAQEAQLSDGGEVVLLDYGINGEVADLSRRLSHAALVRLFVEDRWPAGQGVG